MMFKVGDKVTFKAQQPHTRIAPGTTLVVTGLGPNGDTVRVRADGIGAVWARCAHLEPAGENASEVPATE